MQEQSRSLWLDQLLPFRSWTGRVTRQTLSDDAFAILDGVDTWVVDVTRERPHISHAHLDLALQWVERLKPRRTILTHMNHTLDYATLAAKLPPGVEPGQDGLVMEF